MRICHHCKRVIDPHESAYKDSDKQRFCSMQCVKQAATTTNQKQGNT